MIAKKRTLSKLISLIILTASTNVAYASCVSSGSVITCSDEAVFFNDTYNFSNHDKVIINNSNDILYGVYYDGVFFNLNEVDISTNRKGADAFTTTSGTGDITIKKVKIHTTGASADGINVSGAGVKFTVGDNAEIDANSMGVRANTASETGKENLVILGQNAHVTTHEVGANSLDGTGYGIYAGHTILNASKAKGNVRVILGNGSVVSSKGNVAHAVFANKGGVIELGSTTISAEGNNAHGIFAEAGNKRVNEVSQSAGGLVFLTGDTTVNVLSNNDTKFAIYSKGAGSEIVSEDPTTGTKHASKFIINGNLKADQRGLLDLSMSEGSTFTGKADSVEYNVDEVQNTTTNGTLNLNITGENSVWNMTESSVVTNLALNNATLNYVEPADTNDATAFTPKNLIVSEEYGSDNGYLTINTVLGDDSSKTDKLIVKGDTSGTTKVRVTNIGGEGALTQTGIEIVKVSGQSNGIFKNAQRIVAGAFDYFVTSGKDINGADSKNWYLVSHLSPVDVEDPIDPVKPIAPVQPVDPVKPIKPVKPAKPVKEDPTQVYRPEMGEYLANIQAANTLFNMRLHDRIGETQYTDILTGEEKVTSMWMRHIGGHNRFKSGNSQLSTQANRYIVQLGGDVAQWSSDDLDRWHLGLMAGYANSKSRTHSNLTQYRARGEVSGYSVGVYGTWYANEEDKTGSYVDTWMLYNWFDNTISGRDLQTEKYKSDGITASVEAGYTYLLGHSSNQRDSYWLQPKAQLTWMDVRADDHTESNGTRVKDSTAGNLQTRLGIRAYIQGHHKMDDAKDRTFQPFVEANWIHNFNNYSVQMNNEKNEIKGSQDIGELKVGVEGQINKNLQLWGNVAQQLGDDGYSDTQGMLGIKYSF
ncbi:autotransporter outer membrane beta-barrel domain-containing protein [Citrobacter tructae]|uniref:autotransporter outer membrane beta-barrel domain-containing protein n=1 Tax=Citrobacter tructae TaxID=2562449 RepID=UPI003F57C40E